MADLSQIRYYFEHRFLPKAFYDQNIILPLILKQNPNSVREYWKHILEKEGAKDNCPDDAWAVQGFELDPHTACTRIICPEPEREAQCHWIYLLYTYDLKKKYYFTVEAGNILFPDPFLCGWTPGVTHQNFGNCPKDIEKALDQAIEVFGRMKAAEPSEEDNKE